MIIAPGDLKPGTFNSRVQTEWLDDGREMLLLRDLWYRDKSGSLWFAGAGSIIDGASIPRFCWRVVGSPFVGRYRRGTVIHDVYCKSKKRPHKDVHAALGEMIKVDGVGVVKHCAVFNAVNVLGPKW